MCVNQGSYCSILDLMHVQSCFSGQTLLTNFVNVSTGSGFVLTGYPILCVDGTFLPLCNSSSLTYLEAESLCIIEGQYGKCIHLCTVYTLTINRWLL